MTKVKRAVFTALAMVACGIALQSAINLYCKLVVLVAQALGLGA